VTDIRVGGVARESLVSSTGELRVAGSAREALVSGVGLFARGSAVRSSARGVIMPSAIVYGRARGRSTARGGMALAALLEGRVTAMSSAVGSMGTGPPPLPATSGFNRAVTIFT
jgi:hypothetical protein